MDEIFIKSKSRKAKAICKLNLSSMSEDISSHIQKKAKKQHLQKRCKVQNKDKKSDTSSHSILSANMIKNKTTDSMLLLNKDIDFLGFLTSAAKSIRSTFDMLSNIHHTGSICFMRNKVIICCITDCAVVNAEIDLDSCDVEDSVFNPEAIINLDNVYNPPKESTDKTATLLNSITKPNKEISKEMFIFNVSLPILNQCMSSVTHADVVSFRITKDSYINNQLLFEVHNKKHRYKHKFSIPISRDFNDRIKLSILQNIKLGNEKKFRLAIHMSTQEFLLTLRTSKKSGNTIQILANQTSDGKNWCHFCTAGIGVGVDVISSHRFLLEDDMDMDTTQFQDDYAISSRDEYPDPNSDIKSTLIYCNSLSIYSTPLLINLAKTSSSSRIISLFCNESKDVIGIKHSIGVIGTLMCMMAPLEQNGFFRFVKDIENKCDVIKKQSSQISEQQQPTENTDETKSHRRNTRSKRKHRVRDDIIQIANEFI